jgi:mycothiol synthase
MPGAQRVSTDEPETAKALEADGFRAVWDIWQMGIDLDAEPPAPAWPDGVSVRTFAEGDARAVKALLDDAYGSDDPLYDPMAYADWHAFMLTDASFDPDVWFIAEEGGDPVAAALNWKDGFVKDLVVSPRRRRLGLGKALMLHTFAEFRRRGVARVTLKTDSRNPTQAFRLYEHLGMRVERVWTVYEKRS